MKTRISVIIPMFNTSEYLKECLDSVLSQTINDMELTDGYERNIQVILVDDGSTDKTSSIAKKYCDANDNFLYLNQDHLGVGHARNYGCSFAEGDYIAFLDSDDMIPPKAYEWLYNAAVKYDSDMAIGSVWRFYSKGCVISKIHEKVFNTTKEVTHITSSPQLFYDTTVWNKLIKKSFWDREAFKFPENILYEDMPVSILLHFKADKVAIVYENCYLWRIREGKLKSITQTTNEIKTLNDRLSVMMRIDNLFNVYVDDLDFHHFKNQKWLKMDLMLFIYKLRNVSDAKAYKMMKLISSYISNHIPKKEFIFLNEFEQLKYEYLLDYNLDKLIQLLDFESNQLKVTKVYKKDSHVLFDSDKNLFKTSKFYIDKYIRDEKNIKYIDDITINDHSIEIKGFSLIQGVDIKSFDDRKYKFWLLNENTKKRLPLEFEDLKLDNLNQYKIRFGRNFSYDYAGFKLKLKFSDLYDKKDLTGNNRILVSFTQEKNNYNFFLASPNKNLYKSTNEKSSIYKNTHFKVKYTLKDEFILSISPIDYIYDNIYIKDNYLTIDCEFRGNLFIRYVENIINDEINIPFEYWDKSYKMPLNQIRDLKGVIVDDEGHEIIYKTKSLINLEYDGGQCIISTLNDYYLNINLFKHVTFLLSISQSGGLLKIDANLDSPFVNVSYAEMFFKNKIFHEKDIVCEGESLNKTNKFRFSLDLSNKNTVRNLFEDFHLIYIRYYISGEVITTPLHSFKDFDITYSKGHFTYNVHHNNDGLIGIDVAKKWNLIEDTPGKRFKHSNYTYKFFLKLPVNKKRIIFESIWGSKYSCNPRYLYEYINENYPEYECIWVLTDPHTPIKGDGIRVRRNSVKYFYYLATSKYLVNNVNFHDYFIKRPEQIEIQTTHGTSFKTLGLDVQDDFTNKNVTEKYIEKCSRWDYLCVQNDFFADITKRCFNFKNKFLKYGFPRTDLLYTKNNPIDILKIKEKLNLPLDKKVILYAPTWRVKNKFDLMLDVKSLKKSLGNEYILILKIHPYSQSDFKEIPKDDFVYDFSDFESVEELCLVSDVLISDYSSVVFDFAILDRPILLFVYDLKEYNENIRGLYIDLHENAPGSILYTSAEVENALINLDKTESECKALRRRFADKFNQFECENSSQKIFNEVIKKG